MTARSRPLPPLLALIIFLAAGWAIAAEPEPQTRPATPARLIRFNCPRAIGLVYVQPEDTVWAGDDIGPWIGEEGWRPVASAVGDVVIPAGHRGMLAIYAKRLPDLKALDHIPPDAFFALQIFVQEDSDDDIGDECMLKVARLTGLRSLHLHFSDVGPRGFLAVRNLRNLSHLALPQDIADAELRFIHELAALKALSICRNDVSSGGLAFISRLQGLESVFLYRDDDGDAAAVHLRRLPNLRHLTLNGDFSDSAIVQFRQNERLLTLDLQDTNINSTALVHIAAIPNLEKLSLRDTEVDDRGMVHLKALTKLRELDLARTAVTDNALFHLKAMHSLRHLILPNEGIGDAGMKMLAELKDIQHLRVGGSTASEITDAGLAHLATLKNLQSLLVGGDFSDDGLKPLADLRSLESLSLTFGPQDGARVTNKAIENLAAIAPLRELSIGGYPINITPAAFGPLGRISLRKLSIQGIARDDSTLDLSRLNDLEELDIVGFAQRTDQIRDDDVASLARLRRLRSLHIVHRGMTDNAMAYLARLGRLENLSVGGDEITDNALVRLTRMNRLAQLRLTGHFTDAGLVRLQPLTALKALRVNSVDGIDPLFAEELHHRMPGLLYVQLR